MKNLLSFCMLAMGGGALAAPVTYEIEPNHTHPAIETDHMGGLSVIRGKFDKTAGKIVLDKKIAETSIDEIVDVI